MKKLLLFATGCLGILFASAQMENPVSWTFTAKKIADKTYEIHITATVTNKWHIYAQEAGEGPEPTTFSFSKNPLLKLEGKVIEKGILEKAYDPNFKSTLKFYSNTVDFVQKVKVKTKASTVVKGSVTYMACNDRRCIPPKEIPFSIKLEDK